MRGLALVLLLAGCPKGGGPYPDGRGIEGQLEREVRALNLALQEWKHRAETCGEGEGAPEKIFTELHQVLKASEAAVTKDGRVTVVTLHDDTLFSEGTLVFRVEARMALDMVATSIKLHPQLMVTVEGHTDDGKPPRSMQKRFPTSWEWSYAKANAVRELLTHEFGLEPERFAVKGRAGYAPVAENDTDAGKARNRRVVVYIYPRGIER